MNRREALAAAALGVTAAAMAEPKDAPINPRGGLKITKLETFLVQPRWLFLKVHTDAGIVGLGEPVVEGRAETVASAVKEIEPYLVGKDPRQVTHHWQAIYRHAFYRGDPVLTSALSDVDMALWDIKGKALGVPVYELLGGPTRSKVRLYHQSVTFGSGQTQFFQCEALCADHREIQGRERARQQRLQLSNPTEKQARTERGNRKSTQLD
jgi:galactonate dehydratase